MIRLASFVLLMCWAIPGSAFAQGTGETARARNDAIILSLTVDASITSAALQRAGVAVRESQARLVAAERKLRDAQARADLSERERRRIAAEHVQVRAEQSLLIEQLRAKDVQYAAELDAYRKGLLGLLDEDDPRMAAALERYALGDGAALDTMQQLSRINRQARDAGARANLAAQQARSAAEQRAVARVFLDAVGKGQKRSEDALRAWEEAAQLEPGNADQWLEIARLKRSLGDTEGAMNAAVEFFELGASDQQRASGWVFFSSMNLVPAPASRPGGEGFAQALKLLRRIAARDPADYRITIGILSVLDRAIDSEVGGLDYYPTTVREAEVAFATGGERMIEADQLAASLLVARPADDDVLRAVWQHWRIAARFTLRRGSSAQGIALFEKSFAAARMRKASRADDLSRVLDEALELEDHAEVARLHGDYAAMRTSLIRSAELNRRLAAADPGDVLKRRELWTAHIRVARLATLFADGPTARAATDAALAIGRQIQPERNSFVVGALAQRAMAIVATGEINDAAAILDDVRQIIDREHPEPDVLASEADSVVLSLGDLALYRRSYHVAERWYRTLLAGPAPVVDPAATMFVQAALRRFAAHMRLADLALESGDIVGARGNYQTIRDDLAARPKLEGRDTIIAIVEMMIGHLTPGFTGWGTIADALDRVRGQADAPFGQQDQLAAAAALMHALAAQPLNVAVETQQAAVAAFERSAQLARSLAAARPDDKAAATLAFSMALARSRAGGGRDWSGPLALLTTIRARGWILDNAAVEGGMVMVLARSRQSPKATR